MDIKVFPSKISGELRTPSSKSQSIRAIAAAMLASGTSQIYYPSTCDDALAMTGIAETLGSKISSLADKLEISGGFNPNEKTINCGESGLAARLLIAIASMGEREAIITGNGTLLKRHLGNITQPLIDLGVKCKTNDGYLPFKIQGSLKGGIVEADGSGGSQFISGLLMALPLAENDSELRVRNLKSIPYIDMTLEVLSKFGIKISHKDYRIFEINGNQKYLPARLAIEGDWSGASFPLVAGALAGNLKISGLDPNSRQADLKIISVLSLAGAELENKNDEFKIRKSKLNSYNIDATHCPDLFPPLVVLAATAKGKSKITGLNRLSQKESNRGLVLQKEMGKLGIQIDLAGDVMIIHGGQIKGGTIFSHHDHRIAMAGAVAALVANGSVTIQNAECVSKSYPGFFDDMKKVGVKLEVI